MRRSISHPLRWGRWNSTQSGFSSKKAIVHDYSVSPTTFQYRLPSNENDQNYNSPYNLSSPFSMFYKNSPLRGMGTQEFFDLYPLVNSKKLFQLKDRPNQLKMLSGDFIDDSLNNPNYGYLNNKCKSIQIDSPFKFDQGINLKSLKNFELQLWNNPTEIFQPYYGEAIARYLLVNYKLNLYPYNDLIIYEIDPINTTLMFNILNFIKLLQPEVYLKTQYRIISDKDLKIGLNEHDSKIQIINKSIFEFNEYVPENCFMIGLNLINKFSHDVVKYDIDDGKPYQGYVLIDENNEFYEFFSPEIDEWTNLYLQLRENELDLSENSILTMSEVNPLTENKNLSRFKNWLSPFENNLSRSEFVPTKLLKFFNILHLYFPDHQLILSDFDSLPNRSNGFNSPALKTLLNDKIVNSSTYLVKQGHFDISFPTNFHLIRDIYIKMCGRIVKTTKHSDFLSTWSDLEKTNYKNENPLLTWYSNSSFLHS